MKDMIARYQQKATASSFVTTSQPPVKTDGEILVELKGVNVSYHERKVRASYHPLHTSRRGPHRYCKI